jgi:hypothetical protein
MDFTGLFQQVGAVWEQIEAAIVASPELAGVGLALALGAGAAVAFLLMAGVFRIAAAVRRVALASAVKRDNEIGARILIVAGNGGKQRSVSAFMRHSVDAYLKDYMFGGLFRVIAYPGGLEGDERAEKLMKRTEAEIIIWAETPRGARGGVARILCRPSNTFEQQRPPWTLAMPKERGAWSEALSRAMAYAVAKAYRPALGRPQDFRPERLQPVVESLISILTQKPKADQRLLAELVDDAASGALQMAFAGDETWLDRSVDIARATLAEINRAAAPDRWIAANITLGRALRLKAEKRFDPVLLREGMSYLTEALEALRSEPRFKLAESAAQAIGEAQKLLGTRRKFSISGGGL